MADTFHHLTDVLANVIRTVDGEHNLGAGALAGAILESLSAQSIAVVDIPEPVVDRDGRTRVNLPGTKPGYLSPPIYSSTASTARSTPTVFLPAESNPAQKRKRLGASGSVHP